MTTTTHTSTVAQTRSQLAHLEMLTDATLQAAHTQALHALKPVLDPLYKQIQAMQQSGTQSGIAWLYGIGQLHNIQNAVHFHIDQFSKRARDAVDDLQLQAAKVGIDSTRSHLENATGKALVAYLGHVEAHMTNTSTRHSPLFAQFGSQASKGVTSAIVRGVSLNTPVKQIAADVGKVLDSVLQRALVIAGEAMMSVFRGVSHATMQVNADVALGWLWIADIGANPSPCIACILMHGTKHPLSSIMQSHTRCRCQMVTYFSDNPDIAGQSGTDWFLAQDAETQQEILGNARYAYWKQGAFTLQDMLGTDSSGAIYVKSLKELGVR